MPLIEKCEADELQPYGLRLILVALLFINVQLCSTVRHHGFPYPVQASPFGAPPTGTVVFDWLVLLLLIAVNVFCLRWLIRGMKRRPQSVDEP